MTKAKEADNADENGGNMELSVGSSGWAGNYKSLLLYCSVDEVVEDHEGEEGDDADSQHRDDSGDLEWELEKSFKMNLNWPLNKPSLSLMV